VTEDIDATGTQRVVHTIIRTVCITNPVHLSIDDVSDPEICPGIGAPESRLGTGREMRQITRGLELLRIVGADIGGPSPSYDDTGETTAPAASDLAFEISIVVKNPDFEGPKVEIGEPRLPEVSRKTRNTMNYSSKRGIATNVQN